MVRETMNIPYLDLSVKNPALKAELLDAVDRVLSHGRIMLGPEVDQFEETVAEHSQREYAVGVNSGSDALFLALRALDVGHGDEVITTPMSWISTLNAIVLTGATPVFVDIGQDLNMDPHLLEQAITPRTKVILPVHWTGRICQMDEILEIAQRHGVDVVEDAAQAFGAHVNGAMSGSFGRISCFSMNPMKVFCAYGEAGAVVTDDEELYHKVRALRYAGTINREDCHYPSLNSKIDTMQAAMLLVNFGYLADKIAARRAIARFYSETLGEVIVCPKDEDPYFNVYYTYTIVAERRDQLKEHLADNGIETKVHHPILMPYHTAYRDMPKPNIPVAEHMVSRILSIPSHENITTAEAEYIAGCVKEFYEA